MRFSILGIIIVTFCLSGCVSSSYFIDSPLVRDGYITDDDMDRILAGATSMKKRYGDYCEYLPDVIGTESFITYLKAYPDTWAVFSRFEGGVAEERPWQAVKDDVLNTVSFSPCISKGEKSHGVYLLSYRRHVNAEGGFLSRPSIGFWRDRDTGLLVAQDFNWSPENTFIETSLRGSNVLILTNLAGTARMEFERVSDSSMRVSIPLIDYTGAIESMLDLILENKSNLEVAAAEEIIGDRDRRNEIIKVEKERAEREARAESEKVRQNSKKSDFWSGVGSALYTGLQAANEVMAEQTAQSQAELDASLRAVNAQAAAERQQEADAAVKAQAERRYRAEQQAAYNAALAQGYSQAEASRQADALAEAAKQRESAHAQYARQQAERERRIAEQEREAQLNAQRVMQRFTESSSLAAAAGASGASQEVREYRIERTSPALAWCYQYPTGGRFKCDGPLQRMSSSETSFRYALEIVGCGDAGASESEPAPGASEKYYCGRSLSSTDRVMLEESPFQ